MRLSYCTNVHPAEDLDGVLAQLREYAGPIRRAASLDTLGVGLWSPAGLAARLAASQEDRDALRGVLTAEGLTLHTVNAFPYGGFHDEVVKHAVYLPTWAEPERLEYTFQCAQILADLMPAGEVGSISTLPLAWRDPWTAQQDAAATAAFAEAACGYASCRSAPEELSGSRSNRSPAACWTPSPTSPAGSARASSGGSTPNLSGSASMPAILPSLSRSRHRRSPRSRRRGCASSRSRHHRLCTWLTRAIRRLARR